MEEIKYGYFVQQLMENIDKGINKSELCKKVKISTSTMTNGELVNLSILEGICRELNFNIEDVVEIKNTNDIQS